MRAVQGKNSEWVREKAWFEILSVQTEAAARKTARFTLAANWFDLRLELNVLRPSIHLATWHHQFWRVRVAACQVENTLTFIAEHCLCECARQSHLRLMHAKYYCPPFKINALLYDGSDPLVSSFLVAFDVTIVTKNIALVALCQNVVMLYLVFWLQNKLDFLFVESIYYNCSTLIHELNWLKVFCLRDVFDLRSSHSPIFSNAIYYWHQTQIPLHCEVCLMTTNKKHFDNTEWNFSAMLAEIFSSLTATIKLIFFIHDAKLLSWKIISKPTFEPKNN